MQKTGGPILMIVFFLRKELPLGGRDDCSYVKNF